MTWHRRPRRTSRRGLAALLLAAATAGMATLHEPEFADALTAASSASTRAADAVSSAQTTRVEKAVTALLPGIKVTDVRRSGHFFLVDAVLNGGNRTYRVPADLTSATQIAGDTW